MNLNEELINKIADILMAHGESFQGRDGVDRGVCTKAALEIIELLRVTPIRVMVAVRGGLVQGALADLPNVTLDVYDYDIFESEEKDDSGRTEEEAEQEWDDARKTMHPVF